MTMHHGPRYSIIPADAVTDPRLKPRDLQMLCMLGRHTNRYGFCVKSQVKISKELGCARSTVQKALDTLVEVGYVERRRKKGDNGRDEPNEYRVLLDRVPADFDDDSDCQGGDRSVGQGVTDQSGTPCRPMESAPKNDHLERNEREARARARSIRDFKRAFERWPTHISDSTEEAQKQWLELSDDEQAEAAQRQDDYVAAVKAEGRRHTVAYSVYLRERRWRKLPDKPAETDAAALNQRAAKPWGKLWNAWRLAQCLRLPRQTRQPPAYLAKIIADGGERGEAEKRKFEARHAFPAVNAMFDRAANHQPVSVPADLLPLCADFVQVATDGPVWAAWQAVHADWRWPVPDKVPEYVWLPPGRTAEECQRSLREFEAALDDLQLWNGGENDAGTAGQDAAQ